MKRKLLLAAITFAVLFGAFYAYRTFSATFGPLPGDAEPAAAPAPPTGLDPQRDAVEAEEVLIVQRDPSGRRIEAVYRAEKWVKIPETDATYRVTAPQVEYYLDDGQKLYLRADEGAIYAQEVAGGFNPRRGTLSGNVRVLLDRQARGAAAPPEDRPQETIRGFADNVTFDNDLLTLRSSGPIKVLLAEAEVYGEQLTLTWNESPRELVLLRLEKGERMIFHDVPGEMSLSPLEQTAAEPGEKPAKPAASPAPPKPAPKPDAATAPAAGNAEDREARNVYRAVFDSVEAPVEVDTPYGRMRQVKRLAATFAWHDAEEDDAPAPQSPAGRRGAPGLTEPAEPPRPAEPAATTRPSREDAEPREVEIRWDGPLELRPVGYRPPEEGKEGFDLRRIDARGEQVALSTPRMDGTCERFVVDNDARVASLSGSPERPARVKLEADQEAVCQTIEFHEGESVVRLSGPGRLRRLSEPGAATAPATAPAKRDHVEWSTRARLALEEVPEAEEEERKIAVREALFVGDVKMSQSGREEAIAADRLTVTMRRDAAGEAYPTAALAEGNVTAVQPGGNHIRCRKLNVAMTRDEQGRSYPARAEASGDVRATQDRATLEADKAVVLFAMVADPETKQTEPEPVEFRASGNVKVTEKREDGRDVAATGVKLTSDLRRDAARLFGSPARVREGENSLVGKEIRLDDGGARVRVLGAGKLHFLSRRDLNGRDLAKARPVDIEWSRGMDYDRDGNVLRFTGDVDLDSGNEQLDCREMRLYFEKLPEGKDEDADEPDAAGGKPERPLALGVDAYSGRKIAMIVADGAKDDPVELFSRERDPKDRLLRRLRAEGEQLTWDAKEKEVSIVGAGELLVEDYRPPEKDAKDAKDGSPADDRIRRPFQTAFRWTKLMTLSQKKRRAYMEGRVRMAHASGKHLVLRRRLKTPAWGKLDHGRLTRLYCHKMIAHFAAAEPDEPETTTGPTTQPATEPAQVAAGPRIGPLEYFQATGDVDLKDGVREVRWILAQVLTYDADADRVEIYGSLPNRPPSDARLQYDNLNTQRSNTVTSPKIIWYRKNDKIVTGDLRGSGGR